MNTSEENTDRSNTTHTEDKKMLTNFCQNGFDNDLDGAALALGRPREEIEDFLSGEEQIDEDMVMKMRGIAQMRGITIE